MTQRRLFIGLLVVFIVTFIVILMSSQTSVDLLLTNGVIYTVDRSNRIAEAVAVRDGSIVAVGSTREIESKYKAKSVIDLGRKPVYPGFIDSHAHFVNIGTSLMTLDLTGVASPEDAARLVSEQIAKKGPSRWVRGRGWDQNLWAQKQFPSATVLDRTAPSTPVYLIRVDGHAVWVNTEVMKLAGITGRTPDPAGGKIIRNASGEPTGVFLDNAILLLERVLPPPSDEELTEAIGLAVRTCVKFGLTEVHDMGVPMQVIRIYKRLIDRKNFQFRIYAAIDGTGETWEEYKKTGPEPDYGNHRLAVRAIKMYVDGALGSRGAALIEPYSDDPQWRGLTIESEQTLRTVARESIVRGFQLVAHAIGDRANAIYLDVCDSVFREFPGKGPGARFRDEHAQVVDPRDIPRFARLGVIPSMQPVHCVSDMRWAEARLGPVRILGAYAWRSLLATGVIIAGGSDAPVESPDPLLGFHAAIARQDTGGIPSSWREVAAGFQLSASGIADTSRFDGGWYPGQCMTREEALKAFTIWGAQAAFQEEFKGSIEPGKVADFTILTNDIMKIPPAEILRTGVDMTIIGGEIVYAKLGAKKLP